MVSAFVVLVEGYKGATSLVILRDAREPQAGYLYCANTNTLLRESISWAARPVSRLVCRLSAIVILPVESLGTCGINQSAWHIYMVCGVVPVAAVAVPVLLLAVALVSGAV